MSLRKHGNKKNSTRRSKVSSIRENPTEIELKPKMVDREASKIKFIVGLMLKIRQTNSTKPKALRIKPYLTMIATLILAVY